MDVRFILVSIPDPKKKSLIARRVGRLPNVGMSQALAMLDRLPVTILGRLAYDISASLAKDLEAMGCKVQMEPLDPEQVLRPAPVAEEPAQVAAAPAIAQEPVVFRRVVSFPSLPEDPKPFACGPKTIRRLSLAWVAGIGVVLIAVISLWLVPVLSKPGQTRRELQKAEQRVERHPEDATAVEVALSAYAELAQSDKNMAKRIEHLTKAVRLRSDDGMFRSMLARAYTDSASRQHARESRARFYQIAISFNKYNEQAWDGLIQVYDEMGKPDLAQEARARKSNVFGEPQEGLDQILGAYGEMLYSPVVRNDTLFVAYQSRRRKPEGILRETYVLCYDFRSLHPASRVKMEIFVQGKRSLTVVSPLRSMPDDFGEWKRKAQVKKSGL